MLAITTQYKGPTDHRAGRIKATTEDNSAVVEWDHSLSAEANHRSAVTRLCDKRGWDAARFVGGVIRPGYMAWVPVFSDDIDRMLADGTVRRVAT